jgi:hypothetical protein
MIAPGQSHTFTTTFLFRVCGRNIDLYIGQRYCLAFGGMDLYIYLQPFLDYNVSAKRRNSPLEK